MTQEQPQVKHIYYITKNIRFRKYILDDMEKDTAEEEATEELMDEGLVDLITVHSHPITNNYDLYCAICEAENALNSIIIEPYNYKYIKESQRKASKAVFKNLRFLIMDYAYKIINQQQETMKV